MYVKTSFFDVVHEVNKDSKDVSAGRGFFKVHIQFSCNMSSKSARPTLTPPSPIWVKFRN
jgi:hypothetical protein